MDELCAAELVKHVIAIAQDIGPRPAGHIEEMQARNYIRETLEKVGFSNSDIETLPLTAQDTWGYAFLVPILCTLASNILGQRTRLGKLAGGLVALNAAYNIWRFLGGERQPLASLYPKHPTADLVARIPAHNVPWHTLVLIAHTDTNKHRPTFGARRKHFLPALLTLGCLLPLVNGLAQLAQVAASGKTAQFIRQSSLAGLAACVPLLLYDEKERYIDGANDNATAVACLIGLGTYLRQSPLAHTDVWLVFTAAEETGCLGLHKLLDVYSPQLVNAWFIDFEMVGTKDIVFVTRHTLGSYLRAYTPDEESLALAEQTSRQYPELSVHGRHIVIGDEVATLRRRGHRGICLAGIAEDGWLANWHQYGDTVHNIHSQGLERAARFALAMAKRLDGQQPTRPSIQQVPPADSACGRFC